MYSSKLFFLVKQLIFSDSFIDSQPTDLEHRDYMESDQWSLSVITYNWKKVKYGEGVDFEEYGVAQMFLHIHRRPLYHLLNLMFPVALISVVCSLVFLIPPDSHEKINLSLTILLSLVVFMLLIYDKLPETADSVPLLCMYL